LAAPPGPRPRLESLGGFFFRWRNYLFPALLVSTAALFRPVRAATGWREALVIGLGLALSLAGGGLRAAVVGRIRISSAGRGKQVFADRLFTGGLFPSCRNPLYLGNLLVFLGMLVLWNHPASYLVSLSGFAVAYGAIVAAEEAYLTRRFGKQCRRYCREVPRWLPRWNGLSRMLAEAARIDWRRVAAKEATHALCWAAGVVAILGYQCLTGPPLRCRDAALTGLAGFLLAWVGFWVWVQWVKRTGRRGARRAAAR
jgi:protein-S-isoprenylcysteine O-methyltransferase Ste14